jgi:hypothetical protein
MQSIQAAILHHLSLSMLFIPSVLGSDNIAKYKTIVDLVPSVLLALSSMTFDDGSPEALEDEAEDVVFFQVKGKKGKSQKQKKRAQKAGRKNNIDPTPFNKLREPVPMSQPEADDLAAELLQEQKHILTVGRSIFCTLQL